MLTYEDILKEFSLMEDERRKKINKKQGINDKQFGIPLGKVRAHAKELKGCHNLGIQLWNSGYYEAMILGNMILDPHSLTNEDFLSLMKEAYNDILVDEISIKTFTMHLNAKGIMYEWLNEEGLIGRAGWNIAIGLLAKKKLTDKDIEMLLGIIYKSMVQSDESKKWAMNRCLCEIGIRFEKYRDRCISIGEELAVYKDMKVAKGCTSAYAPAWIEAGVRLQESRKKKEI